MRKLAISSGLIEPAEYSGTGIFKVEKKKTKVEEPVEEVIEESPVVVYKLNSKGVGELDKITALSEKLKELGFETLKEKLVYLLTNHSELTAKELAKIVDTNVGTVYTYKHTIKKEQGVRAEVQPELTPPSTPVEATTRPSIEKPKPQVTTTNNKYKNPSNIEISMEGMNANSIARVFDLVYKMVDEGKSYKLFISLEDGEKE